MTTKRSIKRTEDGCNQCVREKYGKTSRSSKIMILSGKEKYRISCKRKVQIRNRYNTDELKIQVINGDGIIRL